MHSGDIWVTPNQSLLPWVVTLVLSTGTITGGYLLLLFG